MSHISKIINWKFYLLILIIFIIILCLIIYLFSLKMSKIIEAILETDENKNFTITFNNSNIQQISESKNLYIRLENKSYFLKNIELFSIGNNNYVLKFDNELLYQQIKPNSLFNVSVFIENKNLFDVIFK